MRTMFVWRSASTLPIVMVSAASTHTSGPYTRSAVGNATKITRISATNPAAFDDTDKNAVTGVGAPSYVSGAQVWNGTADTLKAKPEITKAMAITCRPISLPDAMETPMSTSLVEPAVP